MAGNKTTVESGVSALVTGASSGIWEQFARQIAARGVDLVLLAWGGRRPSKVYVG